MKHFDSTRHYYDGDCEILIPSGSFYLEHIRQVTINITEETIVEPLLNVVHAVPVGGTLSLGLFHTKFPGVSGTVQKFLQTEWFSWMDIRIRSKGASSWQHHTRLFGVRRDSLTLNQESAGEGFWMLSGALIYSFERYSEPVSDGLNILTNKSKRWYF